MSDEIQFPSADDQVARFVEKCRSHPEQCLARVAINNDPWQWMDGSDFLSLWDQPFAGTIHVDSFRFRPSKRV